jgi:hypothetical protein
MDILKLQVAKKLGGYNVNSIKEIREFANSYLVIFVKGIGLRPRFVSKKGIYKQIEMSDAVKMLTPKSTTAKLLQLPIKEIKETLFCSGSMVAIITELSVYFVALSRYKEYFVESRKQRASQVIIDFSNNRTVAYNRENGNNYQLIKEVNGIYCECEDYSNQRKAFNTGCCKHGYALLNQLGFSSLAEYVENQAKQASELNDYYFQRQGIC